MEVVLYMGVSGLIHGGGFTIGEGFCRRGLNMEVGGLILRDGLIHGGEWTYIGVGLCLY